MPGLSRLQFPSYALALEGGYWLQLEPLQEAFMWFEGAGKGSPFTPSFL